jgi:hypothetical protein
MPILVHKASASSIECVVKTTVLYFLRVDIFEMIVHMYLLAYGSTPVLGSSSSTIGGFPIKAMAHDSFLLLPPESVPAFTWAKSVKSISLICFSTISCL